jgi:hypothetical protein
VTNLAESFASMGAPWVSGIRNVRGLADEMRLQVIDDFRTAELHRIYRVGRPMTTPLLTFYSVCTLGS